MIVWPSTTQFSGVRSPGLNGDQVSVPKLYFLRANALVSPDADDRNRPGNWPDWWSFSCFNKSMNLCLSPQ
jgi:hypothetical protein